MVTTTSRAALMLSTRRKLQGCLKMKTFDFDLDAAFVPKEPKRSSSSRPASPSGSTASSSSNIAAASSSSSSSSASGLSLSSLLSDLERSDPDWVAAYATAGVSGFVAESNRRPRLPWTVSSHERDGDADSGAVPQRVFATIRKFRHWQYDYSGGTDTEVDDDPHRTGAPAPTVWSSKVGKRPRSEQTQMSKAEGKKRSRDVVQASASNSEPGSPTSPVSVMESSLASAVFGNVPAKRRKKNFFNGVSTATVAEK